MKKELSARITPELKAKCNALNQFENFDNLFRAVVAVPKHIVEKKEKEEALKRRKQRRKKAA